MSTAVDARRRPSLWSYISFSSAPRRRSVSLPTRNNVDVHEKDDRRRNAKLDYTDEGRMTQSQRSRYLKTGGVLAFIFFLLYLLAPNHGTNIGDVVKGMKLPWMPVLGDELTTGKEAKQRRAELGRRSARSPTLPINP